jgi:predicted MPP superfamily phosphohydrolase
MLLSLISALLLIVAGNRGINSLTVERVVVPMKGLHADWNGTTIVQISDIHLGPFNGQSRLNSVIKEVNSVKGDIVVITGDLVDSNVESLKEAVLPLRKLRTQFGSYYITGM